MRVVIRDGASGSVSIPSRFDLIDDGGDRDSDTGIWETPAYDRAEHQIAIIFDPGLGSLNVDGPISGRRPPTPSFALEVLQLLICC